MLQKLAIHNYAIIDELEIDFSGKFSVITGETGAGKSIIMGALALILGERADSSVLVDKGRKCFVEGIFDVGNNDSITNYLDQNEIDVSEDIIIRREVGTNGKSRAFINDTPVTLSQLSGLSSLLVDLHQQFDVLQLRQSHFQREVLDALAGNSGALAAYQQTFSDWQASKNEYETIWAQKQQSEKELDYNHFQYNELAEAGFRENELEELDAELKLLNHSEEIRSALSRVHDVLQEKEIAVVPQLRTLFNQLQHYSSYHPDLPGLLERLQSSQIELQDIAEESARLGDHIHSDPGRIEQINDRLSLGYKLLKKHNVKITNELLHVQRLLGDRLQRVFSLDEQLRLAADRAQKLFTAAKQDAMTLSVARRQQAAPLEGKVNSLLTQVGMPNARLKVEIRTNGDEPGLYGSDLIEFLFDANVPPGGTAIAGQWQPIRKVASGGELSRLMLCIKSLVAQTVDLPTMIFDEIDTGISGEAARQVGIIMSALAKSRQVICITHQPQIAGRADAHVLVYKELVKGSVKTNVRLLTKEERITAIAKMLSGERPTAAAMENAREIVMN